MMPVKDVLSPSLVAILMSLHSKCGISNNGADWQILNKERLVIINTRYLLETHDGALIYLQTKGYRHSSPEVRKKLSSGQDVDPNQYYFKLNMHFETSAPQYAWLNQTI